MLKKYTNILRSLLVVGDFVFMSAAFLLSYKICKPVNNISYHSDYFFREYTLVFLVWVLIGAWFLSAMGIYNSLRLRQLRWVAVTIIKAMLVSFFALSAVLYAFKFQHVSRLFIFSLFSFSSLFLAMGKILIVLFFRHLRSRGFNIRNVIVAGTGHRAEKFIRYLNREKQLGLNIVGVIDEDPARIGSVLQGHNVIGTFPMMPEILRRMVVDYVVFIVPRDSLSKIESAVHYCETVGVTTSIAVDLFDSKFKMNQDNEMMAGMPMMTYESTPPDLSGLIVKRVIDIAASLTALILISPLYLLATILIKCTSPGPVHFVQERVGLKGRRFKLYKFRTMEVDAEKKLKSLAAFNEMQGPVFKMTNDPRITKVGKFLRKYSIDELPQLWNVFQGDMSLVGPRPPLPKEVYAYDLWHRRRLSVPPGITCTWQAGGRNRIKSFDQWVSMDLEYIDNWSLLLDFKILAKTIPAVLMASGK